MVALFTFIQFWEFIFEQNENSDKYNKDTASDKPCYAPFSALFFSKRHNQADNEQDQQDKNTLINTHTNQPF